MSNEVFIGAGASVSLIPETYIAVGMGTVANPAMETRTFRDGVSRTHLVRINIGADTRDYFKLIPDLYTGCMAKIEGDSTVFARIAYNTTDSLLFSGVADDFPDSITDLEIQPFGAPCPAPFTITSYGTGTLSSTTVTLAGTGHTTALYNVGDKLYNSGTTFTGSQLIGTVTAVNDANLTVDRTGASGTLSSAALYVDEGRVLNSDNWLGLVNSFSPPSVDAEMKQLNLAFGASRDFGFQYKGAETVSGASLDVSLNNMSWLYYALGSMTSITIDSGALGTAVNSEGQTTQGAHVHGDIVFNGNTGVDDVGGPFFHKLIQNKKITGGPVIIPPLREGTTLGNVKEYTLATTSNFSTNKIAYEFGAANSERLPSFGLEVTYKKESDATNQVDSNTNNQNIYGRILTGNQVNTLTLNFEEGQEVKASVDIATRRIFDVPTKYIVQRSMDSSANIVLTDKEVSSLTNFSSQRDFNLPFQYFEGALKIFGSNFARVKTASVTINNNLTQQRYVGEYNRQTMSEHIPAQRTYEIQATCLITDTKIWDELRSQTENASDSLLEFNFQKDTGETFNLKFQDYMITGADIPLPDDKGPIEVSVTIMARKLNEAKYTGGWIIHG